MAEKMHNPAMKAVDRSNTSLRDAFDRLLRVHDDGGAEGYVPTAREDIKLFWNREPVPRGPRIYDPGIVIIGRGFKLGYKGNRRFRYDADHCLLLSLPTTFESETHATAEEPLIGLFVNVDRMMIRELAEIMGLYQTGAGNIGGEARTSFEPVPIVDRMRESALRLVNALAHPCETAAIGEGLKRELIYHALRSPGAEGLLALTMDGSINSKISGILNLVHRDFETTFSVEELAQGAGMSVSSFHRSFREVTGDSPVQYIKKVRLHRARDLITNGNIRPSEAASQVGYSSPSQFSREFSRHFSMPPSAAKAI